MCHREGAESDLSASEPAPVPGDDAARRLRALTGLAKALGGTHRLEDVLSIAAAQALVALDATSVSVSRWERERGRLRVLVNAGQLAPGEERFPVDESYAVADFPEILRSDEDGRAWTQAVDDPDADHERVAMLRLRGRHSCVVAPIVFEGRAWGELYGSRSGVQPSYTADDRDFATALAAQIAAGLAQAQHVAEIEQLAFHDPMTGLGNRRAIDTRIEAAIDRHQADGAVVSLIVCDVNGLKRVNDQFGHDVGDRLLIQFAGMLSASSALLPGGLAARLGGDEFCVLFEDHKADEVVQVAEDLCRRARGLPGGAGVSCGVASTGDPVGPVSSAEWLFRLADAAQYRAKRGRAERPVVAGRGRSPDPTLRLAASAGRKAAPHERRRVRGATAVEPAKLLSAGLVAIDEARSAADRPLTTVSLLEVVADAAARLVDGCAWWVSRVAVDRGRVEPVRHRVYREPCRVANGYAPSAGARRSPVAQSPVAQSPVAQSPVAQSPVSPPSAAGPPSAVRSDGPAAPAAADRRDFMLWPQGRAAVRGGGYVIEVVPGAEDPAVEALLAASGYAAVLAAGGSTTAEGEWLVEVFTDAVSLPVRGLAPTLRALVAVALTSL